MATPVEIPNSEFLYKTRKSHRVVVTGIGIVSPLGLDRESTFRGLIDGKTGIKNISTSEWDEKLQAEAVNSEVDVAGMVMGFKAGDYLKSSEFRKDLIRMDRSAQFSIVASREALMHAGFLDDSVIIEKGRTRLKGLDRERFGVILGTGIGGGSEIAAMEDTIRDRGDGKVSTFAMLNLLPERISTVPSMWFGAKAEVGEKTAACASAAEAITDAYRVLERGEADVMLAGGSEAAIHRIALAGFNNIHALNKERNADPTGASRPFDMEAAGFVMGEGAAILTLETLEHAIRRDATILAELTGYGNTADAFHDTKPDQDGAERAMRLALAMAEISPFEVDYINAHGTSTPANDKMEAQAIKAVYGDAVRNIAISSTKSATAHLLGAAGGLEAAISIMAILRGVIPPTLNLKNPIPETEGLNIISLKAQKRNVNVVVSNSLGFGGLNSILVFRKFQMKYPKTV